MTDITSFANRLRIKTFGSVFILRALFVIPVILFNLVRSVPGQDLIPEIKRDDFNQVHGWWSYHRDGSAADDLRAITNGDGYLLLKLRNPDGKRECNVGISEFQNIYGKKYAYLAVEARIKILNAMKPGSRGWGFWKSSKQFALNSLAWFMEQQAPTDPSLFWQLVGTLDGNRRSVKPWKPDPQKWHVYRIERDLQKNTTRYLIDDKLYFETPGLVPRDRLSFHLWVDNQIYSKRSGIMRSGWKGESAVVADYVQIETKRQGARQVKISNPKVLFYRQWNKIFHGKGEYLIDKVKFKVPRKKVYILATVRAESYDGFDEPDQLKIYLDGESGSPVLSFDGSRLKGKTKSVFIEKTMEIGEHSLVIKGRTTPLLYDVLVIDAGDGKPLINESFDKPVNNELRWKWTNVKTKKILFYLAASLKESPRFNQIIPVDSLEDSDDDLVIRFDGKAINENGRFDFCGNKIFGENRSAFLNKTVEPGEHQITIRVKGTPRIHRVLLLQTD
ncbi:MAG: hypothetical protein GXO77_02600 [Calditrichaeota bacterium]|nr:hypothetical protein [Calditrichota bacterium]